MTSLIASDVRDFILGQLTAPLAAKGLEPADVPDSFDLLTEGVIDSFGIVELIMRLEEHYGFEIDFSELDVDNLTRIGPVSRYVEDRGRLANAATS